MNSYQNTPLTPRLIHLLAIIRAGNDGNVSMIYDSDEIKELFESFLGSSPCECPNQSAHTTKSKGNEYIYYLGPETETNFRPIFGKCRHTSCSALNRAHLKQQNKAWGSYLHHNAKQTVRTTLSMDEMEKRERYIQEDIQRRILEKHARKQDIDFKEKSAEVLKAILPPPSAIPLPLFESPVDDVEKFLTLWESQEVLFIGDSYSTKVTRKSSLTAEMMEDFYASGKEIFSSGNTFQNEGEDGRTGDNSDTHKYLILEADHGTLEEQWNNLQWINQFLPLVMVVHSGGKSLHGWVRCPRYKQALYEYLKLLLTEHKHSNTIGIGFDPATFKSIQIVRCPGFYRENKNKWQRILYWNPSAQTIDEEKVLLQLQEVFGKKQ